MARFMMKLILKLERNKKTSNDKDANNNSKKKGGKGNEMQVELLQYLV